MKNQNNILLLFLSLLFFMAADAQAQEQSAEDSSCDERRISMYKLKKKAACETPAVVETVCCVDTKNFYARIFGGANFLQNTSIQGNKSSYQTGYIVDGSLGFCWRCYDLRLEAEYAFRRNAIEKIYFSSQGISEDGHLQTSSYMANLLWDLPCPFWKIQPFIGAGIGYDFIQMHATNSRLIFIQKWKDFSGQVMAGFAYPIFCNTEITVEYKFHEVGSDFLNHSIGVGLVYKFGFLR